MITIILLILLQFQFKWIKFYIVRNFRQLRQHCNKENKGWRQGGHIETIPIESKRFEDWVGSIYYHQQKDYNAAPSTLSKEEISKIESILRYEAASSVRTLYLRIAAFVDSESVDLDENVIYFDLCNSQVSSVFYSIIPRWSAGQIRIMIATPNNRIPVMLSWYFKINLI